MWRNREQRGDIIIGTLFLGCVWLRASLMLDQILFGSGITVICRRITANFDRVQHCHDQRETPPASLSLSPFLPVRERCEKRASLYKSSSYDISSLSLNMSSPSSCPSWLKETPLRFEDIARHQSPPLTIYLPTVNDIGDLETLSSDKYEFHPGSASNASLATEYQWQNLAQESGIYQIPSPNKPIALLWRTVSGATLTLHCLDATRNRKVPRNRPLPAFHFRFPVKIQPNCIGFAKSSNGAVLYVFGAESAC